MGSVLGRHKSAAAHLGISLDEYERHIEADESWCWQCKRWLSVSAFRKRWGNAPDLHSHCNDCYRSYMREWMRKRAARRRAG